MHVVATAGHVDHGKSTLVRALTGRDPDRLEEERRRGLSIELGYCWTSLPGIGEVAFVDVPGHQRFVSTMLAGVGAVPVAMLVVAADDPWMPQAAEHLAALDALGVEHGLLVITRADLADAGPALARARDELAGTTLAGARPVVVSGRTGAGLSRLRRALVDVLRSVPPRDPHADVRLWVDRSFHVRGAGTVVTGTLPAGTISVGDTLAAGAEHVRVRGIESLEVPRESVTGVARVALELGGRTAVPVSRGTALTTPDAFLDTTVVDVAVHGGERLPARPVLHVGSTHTSVHARPLGDRFARLTLEHPLPLRVHDRALLRDPGDRSIWGVEVLDPLPPRLGRRGAAAARARDLATYDGSLAAALRLRGVVERETLRRLGVPVGDPPPGTVAVDRWLIGPERADRLRHEILDLVRARTSPVQPSLPTAEAARALDLPSPVLVEALVASPLHLAGGRVADTSAAPSPELERALEHLRQHLTPAPFAAPDADTLRTWGIDAPTVAALHRAGLVLRLADGVVLLPGAVELAVERLRRLDPPFTASQARRALDTSRRVVLPLLAHLDATGRTLRLPDDTRRIRGASTPGR